MSACAEVPLGVLTAIEWHSKLEFRSAELGKVDRSFFKLCRAGEEERCHFGKFLFSFQKKTTSFEIIGLALIERFYERFLDALPESLFESAESLQVATLSAAQC